MRALRPCSCEPAHRGSPRRRSAYPLDEPPRRRARGAARRTARGPVNVAQGRLGHRAAIALALLAILPCLNGLRADFTFDDKTIVRDNPRLSSPGRVGEIFTSHYFGGPLSTAKNYRPVVLLTYAVQRWTTGTDPLPFHVVNVALHVGTTLLFAAWTLALGMPRGPSLAAAALFAVVPIHVEAVTGIVGRAELLVASLVFLAALLFRRATDGPRLGVWPYAGALVAFLLAVFTKENAVVLPGVVALGELLRRDVEEPLGSRLRRKVPCFRRSARPHPGACRRKAVRHGRARLEEGGVLRPRQPACTAAASPPGREWSLASPSLRREDLRSARARCRPLGPRPRPRYVSLRPTRGRRSRLRARSRGGGPGGAETVPPRFPRNRVLPRDDPPDVERPFPHRDDLRGPARLPSVRGPPRGGGRTRRGASGVLGRLPGRRPRRRPRDVRRCHRRAERGLP